MKIAVDLISGFAAGAPASAQNFNYLPGRVNTYNNSQAGKPAEPRELEQCRFDVLPRSEQRRLNEQGLAKVQEIGMEAAKPWIDRQSNAVIAQMVEAGKCQVN